MSGVRKEGGQCGVKGKRRTGLFGLNTSQQLVGVRLGKNWEHKIVK